MNATTNLILHSQVFKEMTMLSEGVTENKIITWCQEIRDMIQIQSLLSGEIVLISKDFIKFTSDNIEGFFEKLNKRNVVGVVIVRNKNFSDELRDVICENAKKNDLFVFQAEESKDEISYVKSINMEICYLENSMLMEETLLSEFLFKDRKNLISAIERLESTGIEFYSSYKVVIISIEANNGNVENRDYKYKLIKNELSRQYSKHIFSMNWENQLVIAIQIGTEDDTFHEIYEALEKSVQIVLSEEEIAKTKIMVGRACNPVSKIKKSFDQALFVRDMFDIIDSKKSLIHTYDEVGFYRILRSAHNPDEYKRFYMENMAKLNEYDIQNRSNLVDTLEAYINNNCNLINTANELFLHKNSLRYRIQRIEELTGKDLREISAIMDFYLSFRIRDYIGLEVSEH